MMRLRFERARTAEKEATLNFLRNPTASTTGTLWIPGALYPGTIPGGEQSDLLCKLALSGELWKQMIAMMATFISSGRAATGKPLPCGKHYHP